MPSLSVNGMIQSYFQWTLNETINHQLDGLNPNRVQQLGFI